LAFFKWKRGNETEGAPGVEPEKAPAPPPPDSREADKGPGFFGRLRQGLSKTRDSFTGRLDRLFLGKKEITEDLLDDLEEILFTSDIGVATTQELIHSVQEKVARKELRDTERLKMALRDQMLAFLHVAAVEHPVPNPGEPLVIMVVGVNGVGKTTTIGKAAHRFRSEGKEVLLAAGDTFRAAAVEQLAIWGERVGATVIKQGPGADPSAVAFDALTAAVSRKVDVVLVDTAGRLHTKINLMEELQKIHRVIGRRLPGAPHEVWLVLDATTGQNAISQAQMFNKALGVTSIVLTKLDGTAKGGIVVGISRELGIPIRLIGIGEKIDDLREFDPVDFVKAIFD
jgi:fused signal recognition particle receptor